MTIANMAFNPVDGLRNAVSFQTTPANEADARNQVQSVSDQIRDYINNSVIPELNAKLALVGGTLTGNLTLPALIASGLTGATAGGRWVGTTTSGAPTTGTFAVGDFVNTRAGEFWSCTTAGTPGTWTKAGVSSTAANLITGTYTGDGTNNRTINVGFTPSFVMLVYTDGSGIDNFVIVGQNNTNNRSLSSWLQQSTTTGTANARGELLSGIGSRWGKIATNGFQVSFSNAGDTNQSAVSYKYVAVG